jgi:hypothetical protein
MVSLGDEEREQSIQADSCQHQREGGERGRQVRDRAIALGLWPTRAGIELTRKVIAGSPRLSASRSVCTASNASVCARYASRSLCFAVTEAANSVMPTRFAACRSVSAIWRSLRLMRPTSVSQAIRPPTAFDRGPVECETSRSSYRTRVQSRRRSADGPADVPGTDWAPSCQQAPRVCQGLAGAGEISDRKSGRIDHVIVISPPVEP